MPQRSVKSVSITSQWAKKSDRSGDAEHAREHHVAPAEQIKRNDGIILMLRPDDRRKDKRHSAHADNDRSRGGPAPAVPLDEYEHKQSETEYDRRRAEVIDRRADRYLAVGLRCGPGERCNHSAQRSKHQERGPPRLNVDEHASQRSTDDTGDRRDRPPLSDGAAVLLRRNIAQDQCE